MFVWFIKILLSELTPMPTPVPMPSWSPFPPFPFQNFSCPDCICSGSNVTCPTPYPIPPCPSCPPVPTPYPIPPCPPCPSYPPTPTPYPSPTPWPSPTDPPPLIIPTLLRKETFLCGKNDTVLQWFQGTHPEDFITQQTMICDIPIIYPQVISSIRCVVIPPSDCIVLSSTGGHYAYITFNYGVSVDMYSSEYFVFVCGYDADAKLIFNARMTYLLPDFNITVVPDAVIEVDYACSSM